ncbi:MAG: SDR family oxidoreductase [Bacteroidota bacterium]
MHLKDKVALVTGAAGDRSIGWGIAQALAAAGATVALNDLPTREAELKARVQTLQDRQQSAFTAAADITDPDEVHRMMEEITATAGRLDVACSNAGMIRWQHFLEITPNILSKQVALNVKGSMYVCRAAAKQMIAQGEGGQIIVTSSIQTYLHFPITPVYGGTKHAQHIFVGALALELAPHNITVNHIGPGWVQTAMNDTSPELQTAEAIENQKAAIPMHRAGTTNEMADAALYFTKPEAAYTTGAFIAVDGGLGIGKYTA